MPSNKKQTVFLGSYTDRLHFRITNNGGDAHADSLLWYYCIVYQLINEMI